MYSRNLLFVAFCVALCGCGGKNDQPALEAVSSSTVSLAQSSCDVDEGAVDDMPQEEEAVTYATRRMDELFEDFIFTFAGNKRLQRQRISFPLHLNSFGDDMVIERSEWEHQDLFGGLDCYTSFFAVSDEDEDEPDETATSVDFEHINLEDKLVRTFHFDCQDGRWMLTREILMRLGEHELADFFAFYHRFTTDSLYALHSLSHTIHFITTDPEDDFSQIEGVITPDQWPAFAPELPVANLTNIHFCKGQSSVESVQGAGNGQVVMSIRGLSNGMVDEITFSNTDNGWKLTQYENR